MNKRFLLIGCIALLMSITASSQEMISFKNAKGSFRVVANNTATAIYVDANDHAVVKKAALLLREDIEKITGKRPLLTNSISSGKNIIIMGTMGKSVIIDRLIKNKKIKADSLHGKWEA